MIEQLIVKNLQNKLGLYRGSPFLLDKKLSKVIGWLLSSNTRLVFMLKNKEEECLFTALDIINIIKKTGKLDGLQQSIRGLLLTYNENEGYEYLMKVVKIIEKEGYSIESNNTDW